MFDMLVGLLGGGVTGLLVCGLLAALCLLDVFDFGAKNRCHPSATSTLSIGTNTF
jgi:hypothetical protein